MDVEEAEGVVRKLVTEWAEERLTAERAAQKAAGLQGIIRSYIAMFPELEKIAGGAPGIVTTDSDGPPRGAEAVRLILQESPNTFFTVSELVADLKARGWLPD